MRKDFIAFCQRIYSSAFFYAVAIPGALGGLCSWLVIVPYAVDDPLENLNVFYVGVPLSMIFGTIAGLAAVAVLTNPEKTDIPRMLVFGFVAGLAWPAVLDKIAGSIGGTSGSDADLATAPTYLPWNRRTAQAAKKVESGLQSTYALVTANDDLFDTLRDIAARSGSDLASYLEERSSSVSFETALSTLQQQGLITFDGNAPVALTEKGTTVLDRFAQENDIAATLAARALDDAAVTLSPGTLVNAAFDTFSDDWYLFDIAETGNYSILTSGPAAVPTDTVITLYDGSGSIELGMDDDSGVSPYSQLNEYLMAGPYALKVSSYHQITGEYSLIVQRQTENAIAPYTEIVTRDELDSIALELGAEIDAPLSGFGPLHFRFTVGPGAAAEYVFATSGPGDGPDTIISLFKEEPFIDSAGEADQASTASLVRLVEIGSDDDGGEDYYSLLQDYLDEGTYQLRVDSYWGDPGDIGVRVTRLPAQ